MAVTVTTLSQSPPTAAVLHILTPTSWNLVHFPQALCCNWSFLNKSQVMRPVTVVSYVAQLSQFRLETRTALKKTELLFKVREG